MTKNKYNKITKGESIYIDLREKILSGKYPPNKIIKQFEIASEYKSSTIPLREALARLSAEGFVLHIPYVGVMVLQAPAVYLRNIYDLRIILEGAATLRAVNNFDERDIHELEHMFKDMEKLIKDKDLKTYQELNEQFHFFIYSRCKNDLLIDQIRILWQRFPRDTFTVIPSRLMTSYEEHKQIIRAIKVNDPTWCNVLMVSHIRRAFDDISRYKEY